MLKKSIYQPTANYSRDFRTQHEAAVQLAEEQRQADIEENARLQKARLAKVKAERDAKQQENEREIDQILKPRKETIRHQWLADHPGFNAEDFEKQAWPHHRAILRGEIEQQATRAIYDGLKASGGYSVF